MDQEKDKELEDTKGKLSSLEIKPVEQLAPCELLSESENNRVNDLIAIIAERYREIPKELRDLPDAQEKCLQFLLEAEFSLTPPIKRKNIINANLALTRIDIELGRSKTSKYSFFLVAGIVYLLAVIIAGLTITHVITAGATAKELNANLFIGIPLPIWLWGMIGSITSMLLRAGQFPFTNRLEASRWLLFRPIVGCVFQ